MTIDLAPSLDVRDIMCPQDTKSTCRPEVVQACYDAKWRIAYQFQPKSIFEIGVMAGYSAHAFITGSGQVDQYIGCDSDEPTYYGGPWGWWAEELLKGLSVDWVIWDDDSQKIEKLYVLFDLCHVDGDHSYEGCLHDMNLCWPAVNPGGVMVVDDATHLPGPRRACEEFVAEDIEKVYLEPSPAGSMVFVKRAE